MAITFNSAADYTIGSSVSAIPSGTDRLLVIGAFVGGGESLGTVSLGSQAATQVVVEDSTGDLTALFYIKDADIPAGSNTLTCTGTVTNEDIALELFEGVDQTSPISSSGGGTSATTIALSSIFGVSGGAAYSVCGHSDSIFPTQSDYTDSLSLQGSFSNRGATAYKLLTNTSDNPITWSVSTANRSATWMVLAPAASGPSIDSTPSEINPETSFTIQVSGPATAPTTGNTTGNFTGLTGIAPDSVTGSDPYTITWTLPRTTAKLFDATGYAFDIDIDAESVSSSAIPYEPPTGSDYITVGTIDTGAQVYTDYTGGTFVSTDQLVWDNSPSLSFTDDLNYVVTGTLSATVYRIAAAGTVDVENTITFSLSDDGIVNAVIKPIISNVISSVVN